MKRFTFSLESALRWRKQQLDMEKAKLRMLLADVQRLQQELVTLERALEEEEEVIRRGPPVNGQFLQQMSCFQAAVRQQSERLGKQILAAEQRVLEQRAQVMAAERKVRLIEKLKAQKFEQWNDAERLELEELASESFLARWGKED